MATRSTEFECPELLQELLESDVAYFHAAAECEDLLGFRISHMPGLESLAAGCVAHKISKHGGPGHPQWLKVLEQRLSMLGCGHARFYQQYPDSELEKQFVQNGYRRTEEIALLNTFKDLVSRDPDDEQIHMLPVRSERDWGLKLSLHQEVSHAPDGHVSQAETWLQLERQKSDVGYMEPFLIFCQETVCGAVNYSPGSKIGRLKNLVIHPRWRRKGIGVQAAKFIARTAAERGKAAAGCFALEDGQALNLYKSAGYFPVTRQTEWYKDLQ